MASLLALINLRFANRDEASERITHRRCGVARRADHRATEELPGVRFSNRSIASDSPSRIDLAPTILRQFGLPVPPERRGRAVPEET